MPEKSRGTRKVKDKWKEKNWYRIYAPEVFNSIELGETPAADPNELMNRVTEATVQDLTGDFSKMHIKLRFRTKEVKGTEIRTQFVGHELTNDYVRRLTRRKRTKTEHVVDATTLDGFVIRIKPMIVTERRIQAAQETAIRNITTNRLKEMIASLSLPDVIKSIVSGDMSKEVGNATKIVIPMKKVEIRKSEIISFPASPTGQTQATAQGAVEPSEGPAPQLAAPAETSEEKREEEELGEQVPEELPKQ
ncbi:MAG: 30S ribosomal protein S3ae [Methanomassiliicoccales archaeon]